MSKIEFLKKANQFLEDLKDIKEEERKDKENEIEATKMMIQIQGFESIIEAINNLKDSIKK